MKKSAYSVAVVGATGLVGSEIVSTLKERGFPLADLRLYASMRSAGDEVECGNLTARVELLDSARFRDIDVVFLAASEQASVAWVQRITDAGAVAIDLTQVFAEDPDVPLVVPEVNGADVAGYTNRGLLASPDAPAIALAVILMPMQTVAQLARVVVTTFEPVSGAGRGGIEEMQQQTVELMSGRSAEIQLFPQRIAFNAFPQIGEFLAGGVSRDERQTAQAVQRLLNMGTLPLSITRVRAPLFYGAALSVNIETIEHLTADAVRDVLRAAPGILLQDDVATKLYPTPADTVGQDATCVGRIREHHAVNVLDVWVTIDNIRKGAAVNAVQIAERLIRDHL